LHKACGSFPEGLEWGRLLQGRCGSSLLEAWSGGDSCGGVAGVSQRGLGYLEVGVAKVRAPKAAGTWKLGSGVLVGRQAE